MADQTKGVNTAGQQGPSVDGITTHGTSRPEEDGWSSLLRRLSSHEYSTKGKDFPFSTADILRVLVKAQSRFKQEPPLVHCLLPVAIVGDTHGQFQDLHRVFFNFAKGEKAGWLTQRYVFLGDYVDRGMQSLEVVIFLFLLKIKFRKSFFLLRGNHETKAINRQYGFLLELSNRFGRVNGKMVWETINSVFNHMPLACLVGGSILCMHGGISPKLRNLEDINRIPKPLSDPMQHQLAMDLLWADPAIGQIGFAPNRVRGVSVSFGEDVLATTMAKLNVKLVVRGHQMMMNGFNFFAGAKLITVFTASSYNPDRPIMNRGAVVHIGTDGRIGFKILVPLIGGCDLFRAEHSLATVVDMGHEVVDKKRLRARRQREESKYGRFPSCDDVPYPNNQILTTRFEKSIKFCKRADLN